MVLLRHVAIGVLLFSLVIAVGSAVITDIREQYPSINIADSGNFTAVYDKTADATNLIKVSENRTLAAQEKELSTGDIVIAGLTAVVFLPVSSINIATSVINAAGNELLIPPYIIGIIIGIVIITVVYLAAGAYFKKDI